MAGMGGTTMNTGMGGSHQNGSPIAFNDGMAQQAGMIEQTPLSFGEKLKIGIKGAFHGAGAGLAAGSLRAAGHAMHIDQAVNPMVHDIQNAGMNKALQVGQIEAANHSIRDISYSMTAMEPPRVNVMAETAVMPGNIPNATHMMNTGDSITNMESINRGHQIFDNQQNQQEFLNIQRQNVAQYENLTPQIKHQVDTTLMEQLQNHPASAGKIVDAARGLKSDQLQHSI